MRAGFVRLGFSCGKREKNRFFHFYCIDNDNSYITGQRSKEEDSLHKSGVP